MSSFKMFWFSSVAAVFVCATVAYSQNANQQNGSVNQFIGSLPNGYTVVEGNPLRLDPSDLCCKGYLPTAFFFNKSAPYVAFNVQDLPSPLSLFQGLPIFQLRADEAIVLIGVTPPATKYFSYLPYLLMRYYPPDTTPKPIFASVGDAINVDTVKTLGPDPYNRPLVLILTPDKVTDAQVRAALHTAGYPDAIINTLVFSAPRLNLGLDTTKDDYFVLLHRLAVPTDPAAVEAYLDAMGSTDVTKRPLRVFRVTPLVHSALQPFSTPSLRVRGTGRNEMDLTQPLARLRQAILDRYKDNYNYTEYHSRHIAYVGNEFIQREVNTMADNPDALYMGAGYLPIWDSEDDLTLGENDFLIVYGPRHDSNRKATYMNLNVYASDLGLSLVSVYGDSLNLSAYEYLGQKDPAAGLMYAYQFARVGHCTTSAFCTSLEVPDDCTPWCPQKPCPPFTLDPSTKLGLFIRSYLEPQTRTGPAASELLYDQVIKFSPK